MVAQSRPKGAELKPDEVRTSYCCLRSTAQAGRAHLHARSAKGSLLRGAGFLSAIVFSAYGNLHPRFRCGSPGRHEVCLSCGCAAITRLTKEPPCVSYLLLINRLRP